jgi:hypothetical protein
VQGKNIVYTPIFPERSGLSAVCCLKSGKKACRAGKQALSAGKPGLFFSG